MLGKEDDMMCNLSSPIHIHLIVTRVESYVIFQFYMKKKSQKIKTKLILIIDYTSKRSYLKTNFQDVSDKLLFNL
jgi:hypothetical protein